MLFTKSLIILVLTFRTLINFYFIYVKQGSGTILCIWLFGCPSTICWWPVFPPLIGLGILVENQLTVNVRVYFWSLNSISLICLSSILRPVPLCLDYCSFVVNFKIRNLSPPTLFFFTIIWLLCVPCISWWVLGSACQFLQKRATGTLIGMTLNLDFGGVLPC